jgi:hypothetical protein
MIPMLAAAPIERGEVIPMLAAAPIERVAT